PTFEGATRLAHPRRLSPRILTPSGLPVATAELVFDLAVLRSLDWVIPRQMKGAHVPESGLLEHAPGCDVDGHRLGIDPLHTEVPERLGRERASAFGGVALAPGGSTQPVAELDL